MHESYTYPIIEKESFSQGQNRYLTLTDQKQYMSPVTYNSGAVPDSKAGSIEAILEQDAHALLDKVVTTAFSIVYRIQIYNDAQKTIDYNRLKSSSQFSQLYDLMPGSTNTERRKSMLIKEMHQLDRQKLEEKVNCWKDLSEPVNGLVGFFHQNKELKQDRQFLE